MGYISKSMEVYHEMKHIQHTKVRKNNLPNIQCLAIYRGHSIEDEVVDTTIGNVVSGVSSVGDVVTHAGAFT